MEVTKYMCSRYCNQYATCQQAGVVQDVLKMSMVHTSLTLPAEYLLDSTNNSPSKQLNTVVVVGLIRKDSNKSGEEAV